ncbi:MAG: hypothetical protein PQJ58_01545 [Spirochaetales bacterium]|nr:hypothetical protein [Spirochaetales bacterium]
MMRFLFSIALIPAGLIIGLILKSYLSKKNAPDELNEKIRKSLQVISILVLNPIAFTGAVWVIPLDDLEVIFLPFLGIAAIALGGFISILYTGIRKMDRPFRGSHFCASYYTNIGSIGGLIVFALLGEPGFALMPFYKLMEPAMYFGLGFPIASRFGDKKDKGKGLLQILKDPFVTISMGSILLGFIFNMSGLERPGFYAGLNSILIPLGSALLLISIGMAMHMEKMKKYAGSTYSVLLIKFVLVPFIITGAAWLLGLGRIQEGIPLMTVFILSSMPAGFVAIMPPSLYKLDLHFANAAWLSTMLALVIVVPWLYFSLNYLLPFLIQ